jgi:hypothetical protein
MPLYPASLSGSLDRLSGRPITLPPPRSLTLSSGERGLLDDPLEVGQSPCYVSFMTWSLGMTYVIVSPAN